MDRKIDPASSPTPTTQMTTCTCPECTFLRFAERNGYARWATVGALQILGWHLITNNQNTTMLVFRGNYREDNFHPAADAHQFTIITDGADWIETARGTI